MLVPLVVLAALLTAPPEQVSSRPFAKRALIPLTVGAALLAGGGVFIGVSAVQVSEAQALEPEARDMRLSTATSNRVGGVMLMVGGALVVSIAAFMFWFEPAPKVSLAFVPTAGGGFFSLGWTGL